MLLLEHTEEGAVGVVLNRPSDTRRGQAVPDLADVVADDDPVFIGGPVSPGSVIALAEYRDADGRGAPICGIDRRRSSSARHRTSWSSR